jgi:hypothetical protein
LVEGPYPGSGGEPPRPPLRPLRIGEVLDAAIKLYTRHALSMWTIVLAVIVPLAVIQELLIGASLPHGAFVHNGVLHTPTGQLSTPALGRTAEIVLGIIAPLLVNGALALFLVDAYLGQPLDWVRSLRTAGERLGGLLWVAIIYGLLVSLAFIAFIVPGIWLAVTWSVAIPALMFEGTGGVEALRRSFHLVRGRWWPTFGALLVSVIILFLVLLVVGLIFGAIESGLGVGSTVVWLIINAVSTIVSNLIAYPFIAAIIAVLYIDLRVRKEGLDLEQAAAGLRRSRG